MFHLVGRRVYNSIMLSLIAHLGLLTAALSSAPAPLQSQPEWLMLAYMGADNNLETPMLMDLVEMTEAEENENVVVLALVDRGWYPQDEADFPGGLVGGLEDFEQAKLVRVRKGRLEELEDWGEVDMASPAILERFIKKGLSLHSPKRLGLIMSDHGGGWQGGWSDDTPKEFVPPTDDEDEEEWPEPTDMSLQEMRYGLARGLGERKLDFLGFDACLMANLETAVGMAPYAKWMVASQELEPGFGWYFTPILNHLAEDPQTSIEDLGRVICDSFFQFYADHPEADVQEMGKESTLSVVNLAYAERLYRKMEDLGGLLSAYIKSDPLAWVQISGAHSNMQQFGFIGDESDFAFFDIESLCARLEEVESLGEAFPIKLAEIRGLMKEAVTHAAKGEYIDSASGLTIYWPWSDFYMAGEYEGLPKYEDALFDRNTTPWKDFAESYVRALMSDEEPPGLTEIEQTVEDDTVILKTELSGEDIADLRYALFIQETEESLLMLGSFPLRVPADGQVQAPFFGGWYCLVANERFAFVPIINAEFGENSVKMYVSMLMREAPDEEWREVLVAFRSGYGPEDYGRFLYAIYNEGGQSRYLLVPEGAEFLPLYPRITADGESEMVQIDGAEPFVYHKDERFEIGFTDLRPGTYLVGFVAEDFSGNINQTLIGVEKPADPASRR